MKKTINLNNESKLKNKGVEPMYCYRDSEDNSIWRPYPCYYIFVTDLSGNLITRVWDPEKRRVVFE